VSGLDRGSFGLRYVGNRFQLGEFWFERCGNRFGLRELLLETCGRQVWIERVVVGQMWAKGWSWESCCWRDTEDTFRLGEFSLKRCGLHI
jgi:hypothetical protein